jgi:cell division protein FtsB
MIRLNLNDKDLQIIQSALIYKATTIEKYDNKNSRIKYIHNLLDYITAEKLVLEKFIEDMKKQKEKKIIENYIKDKKV